MLLTILAAVGLAACGASSGGDATSGSGKALHFIYVNSDPSTEPTGAIISNGMKAAAEELGVEADYRSTKNLEYTPTELKRLLENAIAAKPDGLIVSDPGPEALNPTIKEATEQGIPVVLSSIGTGQTKATGALTYVGNDEIATGRLGGELLGEEGASHALVLSIPPGIPYVETREEGFAEGFPGQVSTLRVKEFTDVTAYTNALLAELQKDSSIDAVFSLGSALSPAELAAKRQLGSRSEEIHWATIDIGPEVLEAIKEGTFSFALDQQPYLEGYLPVLYLKQYIELGLRPVQDHVPTGPEVVNSQNVEQIEGLAEQKLR